MQVMQRRAAQRGSAPSTSAPALPRSGHPARGQPQRLAAAAAPTVASASGAKMPSSHLQSSQKALELLKAQQTNRCALEPADGTIAVPAVNSQAQGALAQAELPRVP